MKRTKTNTARERVLLTNHEPIGTSARQTPRLVTTETETTSHVTTSHVTTNTRVRDPKTGRIRGEWITKGMIDQAVITTGEI